ncbi:CaiB/BaiF CoA-transferase family protein [Bacillus sp. FJAT-52991]|uniref:CaiB/BaiF CoA-transferase family protein n=1 Tax=Bacillus kandeliae TaxID=3129297 RepID=A0ABZ2NB35_9BACI
MLSGIKVLDFTQYLPGPYATLRLRDLGAEVIKIERPKGEPARALSDGKVFQGNNRNKESLAFDLKNKTDQQKVMDLIHSADVVVESFRPGVMASLGLGYEELRHLHTSLVYCSLTGYGQTGELSTLGSHDLNYMALSGMLSQMKDESGRPVHPTLTFADLIGGLAASEAIIAALLKRERDGQGSYIDLAITDAVMSLLTTHMQYPQGNGVPELDGNLISYHIYETKDQRFISLAALEPQFWSNFCDAVQKQEWLPHHFEKAEKGNQVYKEVCQLFQSRSFDDWVLFSQQTDCCMAPIYEINELKDSCYNQHRGMIVESPWNDLQVFTAARPSHLQAPPTLNSYSINEK